MADEQGRIVDVADGDGVSLAVVEAAKGGRLTVKTLQGQRLKVPRKRVLVEYDVAPSLAEGHDPLQSLAVQLEALGQEVDTDFLWEMTQDDGSHPLGALANLYFGSASPQEQGAMLRVLLQDPLRFERQGTDFRIRTAEQVAARAEAAQQKAAREAYREAALGWMQAVVRAKAERPPLPADLAGLLDDVQAFAFEGRRSLGADLLARVHPDMEAQEAAFTLMLRTGHLDATNPEAWLALGGMPPAFPAHVLALAEQLPPYTSDPSREDFSHLEAFTIDDATTRDLDDALTVEPLEDGFRLGIHIADPSHFVVPGDPLDAEALRRGLSIYLPVGNVPMFPAALAHDKASLKVGLLRPTLSFVITCTTEGEQRDVQLFRGQVKVAHRLTYEAAEALLQEQPRTPLAQALAHLDTLSQQRRAQRLAAGAIFIERPELKVYVGAEGIRMATFDPDTPARRIVSEAMILANTLAAAFASRQGLPVLYRVQDPPDDPDLEGAVIAYDPVRFKTLFRGMRPSRFSEHALPHAALGLEAYMQVTSPIRRYADLALHRQLMAHLAGQVYPYTQHDLMPALATAGAAEREARAIEQRCKQYFAAVYLEQAPAETDYPALVLHKGGGGYDVELTDFALSAFLQTTTMLDIGTTVQARVKWVRPWKGEIRLVLPDEEP